MVKKYETLIIFDLVMRGFGWLGTNFALDQLHVIPDFLCLSKGITEGFLSFALTVSQSIYNQFLADLWDIAFAYSHQSIFAKGFAVKASF